MSLLLIVRFKGKASYVQFVSPGRPSNTSKNMYQLRADLKKKRYSSNWITFEESKVRVNLI